MLFNETVLITGTRANGRKVYAADIPVRIVDNGIAAAFDEHASASTRRDVMLFIKKSDWDAVSFSMPQIGDVATLPDGSRYAVKSVNDLGVDILTLGATKC